MLETSYLYKAIFYITKRIDECGDNNYNKQNTEERWVW